MTKILLVEDDKSLREIYGVRLLAEGYDIVSAGDGEEALAMAIKERPELIVSDVMMPKISGFDMLDILRSTTETKDINVIMMTALSSEDQRQRGEQLGADRYLVKSQVGIEDVVRTVHEVLQDIPSAAPTAQQTFGTPAPSAVPQPAIPAPTAQPVAAPAPTPLPPMPEAAPTTPQPVAPAVPAAPIQQAPSPIPPAPTPTPVAPQPVAPTESQLPQPTAPLTPAPRNLGDRVIQPLNEPTNQVDVSSLMEQELQGAPAPVETPFAAPAADTPVQPIPPVSEAPLPPVQPQQ